MGLSLGGGVAIRTALDRPDRVAALALCAPYGVSPKTPWGRAGYVLAHTPGANALTWRLVEHSDAMARWSLKGLLHRTSPSAELVSEVRKLAGLPQAGRAWTAFQHDEVTWSGPRTYYGADFPQLVCPVTMLSGDHDGLVPRKDVEAAAARIPDCRFVSVPGAGHWLPRDAPESVLDAAGALVA
jgi:pimeloyl-ACP methyl ester carboxylesterase